MKRTIRRSTVQNFTVTLSCVLFLLWFQPSRLAADPEHAGISLEPTARPEEILLAHTGVAHNTPTRMIKRVSSQPFNRTAPLSPALSHPLINLPPARPVKDEPRTSASHSGGYRAPSPRAQGMAHLVGSHISAVVRPFSTVFRLFSLLAYTGLDALRPTPDRDIPREPPPPVNDGPGMDLAAWEDELDEITRSRSSLGSMELLIGGVEFFPRLERSVADARSSVHLQIYIFDNDDYALDFGRLLKDRSREIDVKVLMDGLGTIMASGVDHESLPESHTPPSSMSSYLRDGSRVKVRKLTNPWLTFDHTKSIVIDRRVAFVGGMNIGREYRHIWHDMMVQVEGPVVGTLQEEFTRTWDYAGIVGDLALLTSYGDRETPSTKTGLYPMRVLKTRIGHSQIYRAQIAAIRRAKRYIYIENPYLSDDVVLHELIMARHRGVDVRVILPRQCNWKTMSRSNVLAANEMLANGIRVYMFPGMSHVKAAVIDGWACLGSANLDKASFRFNREVNLATSHPAFVDRLVTRLFKRDFDRSILLEEARPERPSDRILEMVADLM